MLLKSFEKTLRELYKMKIQFVEKCSREKFYEIVTLGTQRRSWMRFNYLLRIAYENTYFE